MVTMLKSASGGTEESYVCSSHHIQSTKGAKPVLENTALLSLCGEFKLLTEKTVSKEIEGTRVVEVSYQTSSKTGKKLRENAYVRIPSDHLTNETVQKNMDELLPFVVSYLQSVEDKWIKAEHKNGRDNIYPASLGMPKILQLLEEADEGGRFNKEQLEAWFTATLESTLILNLQIKLGIDDLESAEAEDLGKLQNIVNGYKAVFSSLAAPKASVLKEDAQRMLKLIGLEFADPADQDSLTRKIVVKINKAIAESSKLIDL